MNLDRSKKLTILGLVIYSTLGALLRYYTSLPNNSIFEPIHHIVNPISFVFIVIGILFGLISFIDIMKPLPEKIKKLLEFARGVVIGFSLGWGGITAILLIQTS